MFGRGLISKSNCHTIDPFGPHHKKFRVAYSCGSILDKYLKERATQDIDRRAAALYLILAEDRIAGNYTLSAKNIDAKDLPDALVPS
jgi:hypothetical protein